MEKLSFLLGFSLLVCLFSCDNGVDECRRASLTDISETRDLKDFNGVVFNNIGNVFLTQGPEFSFKITGPENVVELTTTNIQNNLLVIGSDACFNGSYELMIEITAPEYTFVNLSGVGDIQSVGQINADNITIEMFGIGKIDAKIYADTLITTIAGTGEVIYSGAVLKHEISCAGTYEVNAYLLETAKTFIQLAGVGDSYIKANEILDVTLAGSGNVYYKGTPVVNTDITGDGTVIDSN